MITVRKGYFVLSRYSGYGSALCCRIRSENNSWDLRKRPVEDVFSRVEGSLGLRLDQQSLVRKRRSLGARTHRGTWVRIEARPLAKIAAQGQAGDGLEAAAGLSGIAKPEWFTAVSWHDPAGQVVWRADEIELVTAAPVRSCGPLGSDAEFSDESWDTLNSSLDSLARQHTARIATPDTETITQALVTTEIDRAFPGQVDWEDHGLAPRGLDAATLWISSLTVPALAERVSRERQADLQTRSGKLMALFCCAKILTDSGAATDPVFKLAARAAAKPVTDLQH